MVSFWQEFEVLQGVMEQGVATVSCWMRSFCIVVDHGLMAKGSWILN